MIDPRLSLREQIKSARIQIVDDTPDNMTFPQMLIEREEFAAVTGVTDSRKVVPLCRNAVVERIMPDILNLRGQCADGPEHGMDEYRARYEAALKIAAE